MSMQASCCLCLTSCTWGWTILEQEVKLENQAALFFPGLYPKGFFQAAMQTGWSLLSCSPGLWSCFFLDCSSVTCVQRLLVYSRNLLHCWSPAVLPIQQTSGCVKPPVRTTACKHEASLCCMKRASAPSSSSSGGL